MEKETEYSLSEIFSIIIKRIWIILLCAALFTGGVFIISKYVIDEQYTASVSMYAVPKTDNDDPYASLNELYYSQARLNTYIEILGTNAFYKTLSMISGLQYSAGELKEMVKMNEVIGTEIFRVQVTTKNPDDSFTLARSIASLAPQKIQEIENVDVLKVVDPPIRPTVPSSPNIMLNILIGIALGLLSGIVIVIMLEKLDRRIKDEDDLLKHYNLPILGIVPKIE